MTDGHSEWRLEKLWVRYVDYGERKGEHNATVTFADGKEQSFTFTLNGEQTQRILDLIREEVVVSAEALGAKLAASLRPRQEVRR